MLLAPPDNCLTIAISSRDSDACVWTSALLLVRQRGHCFEQLARARHREARRERRVQPSARRAVPALAEAPGSRRSSVASVPAAASAPRRRNPSCTCRSSRAGRSRRPPRRPRPCRAPSPSSAPRSCRSTAARWSRAAWPRAAFPACAPLPSAIHACAANPSAAGRRRSRETASGKDGCASGSGRAGRSRRLHR